MPGFRAVFSVRRDDEINRQGGVGCIFREGRGATSTPACRFIQTKAKLGKAEGALPLRPRRQLKGYETREQRDKGEYVCPQQRCFSKSPHTENLEIPWNAVLFAVERRYWYRFQVSRGFEWMGT